MKAFGHKHYLPILKTKAGERWAIANLSGAVRQGITPIFELHEHKTREISEHAVGVCEDLAAVWGSDREFYLDTHWVHRVSNNAARLESIYTAASQADLQVIPVVRLDMDRSSVEQLADVVADSGHGVMIRLRRSDLSSPQIIIPLLESLRVSPGSADLLIDYRATPMNTLRQDLGITPNLNAWRSLAAASGVFPRSLSEFEKHSWHSIDRSDYTSWQSAVSSGLERMPAFADYTVKDPGAPAEFGAPSVSLKYTREDRWLAWQGDLVKKGSSEDMHAVCASLIARPEYSGPGFSTGDQAINDTANHILGCGNATQWLQWCINHHIQFTAQQIAALA